MINRLFVLGVLASSLAVIAGCSGHKDDAKCFSPENPLYANCAPGAPNGCACMDGIDVRTCVPDKSRGLALVCLNGKWEAVEDLSCRGSDAGAGTDASNACASCGSDELCVVLHDGNCAHATVSCTKKTATCTAATCSSACDKDI